jgi:hypothetical protein
LAGFDEKWRGRIIAFPVSTSLVHQSHDHFGNERIRGEH